MGAPPASSSSDTSPPALSVSQLTAQIKELVEGSFDTIWVAGEVSNLSRPQSGHCYFTLKDEHAQIRAVLWRSTASRVSFDLADGVEVVCRGHLDVYAPRGSYQLVVDKISRQGVGALELALRRLREKLAKEGLFDPARKRPLPKFPRRLAFVTSPTGAAIHDFLQVLHRRFRGVNVLVIPCRVQGSDAAEEIAAAIRTAGRLQPPLDVLIVGRGGGSLEDLWAFNEEAVVRAIAASPIPVVSAVGHEIDVTLSDLAADVRALTPTEAAERVLPDAADVMSLLADVQRRLAAAVRRRSSLCRERLLAMERRNCFQRPMEMVHQRSRRVDELDARMGQAVRRACRDGTARLAALAGKLDTLSPLGVLGRGYSLTSDAKTGELIRSSSQLRRGQDVETVFGEGSAVSTVKDVR